MQTATTITLITLLVASSVAQPVRQHVRVPVRSTLDSLVYDEDTDGDKRITIDDPHIIGTSRGDKSFWMTTLDQHREEVSGTYYLSNLLQELKLAEEAGRDIAELTRERIFEQPVDHISRSIREIYWDGLTRSVDENGLNTILSDEKTITVDGFRYIYAPPSDKLAYEYFSQVSKRHPDWNMKVVRLPEKITAQYVRGLDGRHGILSLSLAQESKGRYKGEPFVVPGGRFNEMYGWDSYFIALGLLKDGRIELAKSMVDNFAYEITHYGAILNANRTYYLTRSQPPFFAAMAREVYKHLPRNASTREWLRTTLEAAIREYYEVWMNRDRLTETGLSRYFDTGYGPPPEVEPGHFDAVYAVFAKKLGKDLKTFELEYKSRKIKVPELDEYFIHDRAMRESGHDTSYRLEGRCANLVTVDLNSLLFKIELDIAAVIDKEFSGTVNVATGQAENSVEWRQRASNRKELIDRYLWDEDRGMYFDYDIVQKRRTAYVSATTFYPLWSETASKEQAGLLVKNALPLLEMPGGIVGSTEESRGAITPEHPVRQWDYPNGWSPHQILVWQGMMNYGYDEIAHRLMYRWLYTITRNAANYNGTVPEKFDVVKRTHQVFAEYGNVGTTFSYITREGFGWTNASYQIGLSLLPHLLRDNLNLLIPPEWVF